MKLLLVAGAVLAFCLFLMGCSHSRQGGELRLRHKVTIATPEGPKTFASVVSMEGLQTYNYGAGTSGWGGISCRLTGDAVRVTVGENDFYFLLKAPFGSTPAWTQIGLIKDHFGLANAGDDHWVEHWKSLAQSDLAVPLSSDAYPAIAVMPRGGWMDDARIVTLEEAERLGLRVLRYDLEITRDAVGADPSFEVRYRPSEEREGRIEVGRESFTVVNGTA